ncbi:DUF5776 domain-containing protein [Staphylococcus aureus]|uniref:DUF5776 domain-containing protein n=1 Tax=Staphylococcus aureus TaxID=1280 RepID=UPI002150F38C|nr:DUF5776 domain-containing protein [Staphylococcus aureus]MCR6087455.1 DUF5776 domain-containing protein [Staphylococcus aureus]
MERCVQSLVDLEMDHTQIEAIFVDDLSSDRSYEILQYYEKKYDFIKCVQLEENSGSPSQPRNVGIEVANGEYIALLDADDWLDSKGFPKLVLQMVEHEADFGFGQCFKHTDNTISKLARFASFQEANGLVPYTINKVFRAVGPPGKIFKRSTVIDNDIKFQHMKFGEDKLFFAELISKSKSASMTTSAVYHINRYTDNVSLVKSTDVIEKSKINLEVLRQIVNLEIPKIAMEGILSRIVEIDYMQRFLVSKTFLKSEDKAFFFNQFSKVETIIKEAGFNIEDLLITDKYKNIYQLFHSDKKALQEYIHYMIYDSSKQKYIKDKMVYLKYPDKFNHLIQLQEECIPVYKGTEMIDDTFYEVIELFAKADVKIEYVELIKIHDERYSKKINYELKDNYIYIKSDDINFYKYDFNIAVQFIHHKSALVFATYPNFNDKVNLKRQNFKLEFVNSQNKESKDTKGSNTSTKETKVNKYLSEAPNYVITTKSIKSYMDADFKEEFNSISKGSLVAISGMGQTSKGTPRLIKKDNHFITANVNFVNPTELQKKDGYVSTIPKRIKVIKRCKLYTDVTFKNEPIRTLQPNEELNIIDIDYTKNFTPRLKTVDGYYIIANINFVEVLN